MALEILIPNTGQGDCTFVRFPNGKSMLVDFNRTDVDVDIIELLQAKLPKKKYQDIGKTCRRINYFVNTHPHEDHIRGIEALSDDEFYIDEIWESGHRLYVREEEKKEYKDYYDFLKLIKRLKERGAVKVCKAGRTPILIGSTEIYVFAPSSNVADSTSPEEIHKQCAVLRIQHAGNSILLTGDSDRENWKDRIVPQYSDDKEVNGKKLDNLLESTVLHASHHGSKDFFVAPNNDDDRYERHIDKIKPLVAVVSVGEKNRHGHPDRIAMNIYKKKSKKGVYTTKDHKSMYFAFKDDGTWKYKTGLDFDELISVNHTTEKSVYSGTAASLTFDLDKKIDLELPKRPPKPKREGYAKGTSN